MFFFNLGLGEFLVLFTAASALVTALYLLDRSRRQLVVATLRFWTNTDRPVDSTRRRRIRQWGSLLLQLVAITLLLLALSQLRLGSPDQASLDHVLILDTSSWMAARSGPNSEPLINQAKAQALSYVKAIPSSDRVLVLYADALATPVTSFDSDRRKIEAAIKQAQPGNAALDLRQALDFAQRMQKIGGRRAGEIVFAGAGRTADLEADLNIPPNLRVLAVSATGPNVGLRKVGLRRSSAEADLWQIYVSVRNYGGRQRNVDLGLQFGGAPVGSRTIAVNAGAEQEAAFELRTRAAGLLEARIRSAQDTFPGDDRAVVELPSLPVVPITVCTDQPAIFRPLLEAHPNVEAKYQPASACNPPDKGLAILDRTQPSRTSLGGRIYIEPPAAASPIPVKIRAASVTLRGWQPEHPLGAGLRATGLNIIGATVFTPGLGDTVIAESNEGPIMVARDKERVAVLGFHPARALPYELTTPLLFANMLRWLAPDSFRRWELYAASVGTVTVSVDNERDTSGIRVLSDDGTQLPFSVDGKTLRFFAGRPGSVRVTNGDREHVYSLAIPAVPDHAWTIPGTARRGVPRPRSIPPSSRDIWYWLAAFAGILLLVEWLRYAPRFAADRRIGTPRTPEAPATLRRAS